MSRAKKKASSNGFNGNFDHIHALVDAFPQGMAIIHMVQPEHPATWEIVCSNAIAQRLIGLDVNRFISERVCESLPALSGRVVDSFRRVLFTGNGKVISPLPRGRANSATNSVEYYSLRIFRVNESCVGLAFTDITAEHNAFRAQSQKEEECRLLSGLARVILWRADPSTMEFSYVSPEAEKILGIGWNVGRKRLGSSKRGCIPKIATR